MVGIIIGTVCLIGLVKVVGRHHHHGHGCHRRGRGRYLRGGDGWLETLADELELSAEQQDKVEDHVRAFTRRARKLRGERERTREDVAEAMRSESFDENILGEMFVRHDDALRELRKDFVEMLAHIHYVLDERQRRKLARFIDRGPRPFRGGFHPYRWARSY